MTATPSTYVYSNDGEVAVNHHDYLSGMLNPRTVARLSSLRTDIRGSRCLEVGAGAGSIAHWLAEQVGPQGQVLATDLAPISIPSHPRLKVLRHDIVNEPVPDGPWDLVHTRLLLMHLPSRLDVLRKLAAALAPGGVLVVEDWDISWLDNRAMHAPSAADAALFERYHDTLIKVFVESGVEPSWACQALGHMIDAGLVDVSAQIQTESWHGGSVGAKMIAGTITQLRDRLLAHGMTGADLDRVRELMADPEMVFRMSPHVSTVGYRA